MSSATAVSLSDVRQALDRFSSAGQAPMRFTLPIWKAIAWFRLWRIARRLDDVASRMDANWKDMADIQFQRSGFYRPTASEIEVFDVSHVDNDMRALERDFEILAPLFPRTVERMKKSAAVSRNACKKISRLIPPKNEQAATKASEEYRANQLLDLETLFNEVHGVR